jgi:hypothetical protein
LDGNAGKELIADGLLIPTTLTPFGLDGFDLVLQHHVVPFASYHFEWCPAMFKAACLTIIDLAIALCRHGLMLKDAHPWNILFDGWRPIWVDITSIVPMSVESRWAAADEFQDECFLPLLLMAQGRDKLARAIMAGREQIGKRELESIGASRSLVGDLLATVSSHFSPYRRKIFRGALRRARSSLTRARTRNSTAGSLPRFLGKVKIEVEKTEVPFQMPLKSPETGETESWTPKQRNVRRILQEKKPRTVLDIASGDGWFSRLAASFGSHVVAFDIDAEAGGRLFAHAVATGQSILPLVMDFVRPTMGGGLANHSHLAASERLRCELVLLLGVLHDLIFRYRRLSLSEIADGVARLAARWAVIEFIPPDDPEIGVLWTDWFAGYSLENFVEALRGHFSRIEQWPSYPDGRVLLLCER